jgi:hypothetical protein
MCKALGEIKERRGKERTEDDRRKGKGRGEREGRGEE